MIKKSVFITLMLLLLLAFSATSVFAGQPPEGWQAEYYANKDLQGNPAYTQNEAEINYDWGFGAPLPGMPVDCFSVRWTTTTHFDQGSYTFSVTVDDGVRVWVDGDLIIDQWKVQSPTTYSAQKQLSAGKHVVQMAYFENTGSALAKLWWRQDATCPAPCPPVNPPDPCNPCQPPVVDPCPNPCPPPPPPDPCQDPACDANPCYDYVCGQENLLVDNTDPGFTWGGPLNYRHVGFGGYGANFYWTQNTVTTPANYGKWTPTFKAAGNYEVFVYVPNCNATTTNLRYRVMHNGQRNDRIVNQYQYSNQWVSLGTYYFNGANSGLEYVLAYDNTREPFASRQIAFDAVKFEAR